MGIDPIAPIEQPKSFGGVKQCRSCGSDNKSMATHCVNCGVKIPRGTRTYNQNQRDKKGKQKGANPHEVTYMGAPVNRQYVPGFGMPIESQVLPVQKTIPTPINPIKQKRLISDDDAEFVDDKHLSDVENSANELGL